MPLAITTQPIPLTTGADGVVRVAGTRIPLDSVIASFRDGATPETIVQQYPTLALANVYAVITYYLNHQDEVHTYLEQREQEAIKIRRENESRYDPNGIRDRLLARRDAQE